MHSPRIALLAPLVATCLASTSAGFAHADSRPVVAKRTPTAATKPSILDHVAASHRQVVGDVLRNATLSTQAQEDPFAAHPNVFDWLTEHPDRASLAWRRMGVPCVAISQLPDGRFHWAEDGSELTWRLVGRFEHGMIWYATGRVKPGQLLPTIPVKSVAVLTSPRTVNDAEGHTELRPAVHVYLQTDSRAANAALRVLGPAAPRMAEQGAEQLLLFFTGPARHIYQRPEQSKTLLAPAK